MLLYGIELNHIYTQKNKYSLFFYKYLL